MSRAPSGLTRRAVLRGAGGAAIALPLLPEFMPRAHAEIDGAIPCRLLTMSFGLGLNADMIAEQFSGPLEPLEAFGSKAAMFTNVDTEPLSGSGTPHYRVAGSLFTGVPQVGAPSYVATGPSMERVMKRALHPMGVPNVATPEISAGLWSNTGCVAAFTRQWNDDGSPGQRPIRRPSEVFEILFGNYDPKGGGKVLDPETIAQRHVHRSVLDAVLEDYESFTGANSPLGAESKAKIDNHLSAIRDVEMQLAPTDGLGPMLNCPSRPPGSVEDPEPYGFYDAKVGPAGNGAPQIDWEVAHAAMDLIGQLMALGMACDAVRFGSMISLGAGEYLRFAGQYDAIGDSADFSTLLATGTAHDVIFHAYNPDMVRLHQHLSISMLAHTLREMDQIIEPNGQSILDNALVLMATEYGQNHTASPAFHAVFGGGGRFAPGWYDQALLPSDVYHQSLAAYDIDSGIPGLWADYNPVEITGFRNR